MGGWASDRGAGRCRQAAWLARVAFCYSRLLCSHSVACCLAVRLSTCLHPHTCPLLQEEKTQREAAEAKVAELQRSMDAKLAAAAAAATAAAAAEVAQRQAVEAELAEVRQQVAASAESSAAAQQQLATEMKELREKMAALERQRAEAEVRA